MVVLEDIFRKSNRGITPSVAMEKKETEASSPRSSWVLCCAEEECDGRLNSVDAVLAVISLLKGNEIIDEVVGVFVCH